jgi:hypothetical protein
MRFLLPKTPNNRESAVNFCVPGASFAGSSVRDWQSMLTARLRFGRGRIGARFWYSSVFAIPSGELAFARSMILLASS